MTLGEQVVHARYCNYTLDQLKELRAKACTELKRIKAEKSDMLKRFPNVHGRFQQSQLDVQDIIETKTCQCIDTVDDLIAAHKDTQ